MEKNDDRRIRVMHLVVRLDTGGMENGVINICRGLPSSEFRTAICTLLPDGPLEERARSLGIPVFHVPRRHGNDLRVPWQLAGLLKRERIDVLHSHNWVTLLEAYGASLLARRVRIIHGEHGRLVTEKRHRLIQRHLWPRFNRLLSVSGDLAKRMCTSTGYRRDRIVVVANGVDTTKFSPSPDQKENLRLDLGLSPTRFTIGMIGRFVEFKDHAGTIESVANLTKQGYDIQLALVGNGELEADIRSQVNDLGLNDRVFFLGHHENVAKLLPAMDVTVSNSSHCEGMSNAVLESMACGVPVIGTTTAANPELLDDGNAGKLVPPNDRDALCRAIAELYESPGNLDELSSICRKRVVDHYPLRGMLDAYGNIYSDVCGIAKETAGR